MGMNTIIRGVVIEGSKRGRTLGYPTANCRLTKPAKEGIYVSETRIASGPWLPSITFIGAPETFNENDVKMETYIFDFDQKIYGFEIEVRLLYFLRGNKRFERVEDLIRQIEIDVAYAKDYFDLKNKH